MVIDETLIEATKETQADAKTSIPISSLAKGEETKRLRVLLSDTLKRLKERPRYRDETVLPTIGRNASKRNG
jgi:hypothetical protein